MLSKTIFFIFLLPSLLSSFLLSQDEVSSLYNLHSKQGWLYVDIKSNQGLLPRPIIENFRHNIPTVIAYTVDLYKKGFFFDQKIKSIKIRKIIYYDIWSRAYFVELSGKKKKIIDLVSLRENINYLRDVKVVSLNDIEKGESYFFRSRVSLQKNNLSIYFHLINNIINVLNGQVSYFESAVFLGRDLAQVSS